MEYITTKEAAAKWGISTIRITVLANEGRIPGAKHLGRSWLIPASATKPPERKANHSGSVRKDTPENNEFSFPLYHFRPDWNNIKGYQLSDQQQSLLLAETAVMECRFSDAYPILKSLLEAPEDIGTEIGCLWTASICCIALNKPDDFSGFFLRLKILLSEDYPHRDDLAIILDGLDTYIETIAAIASKDSYNTDIHEQCLPMLCTLIGYSQLAKEAMSANSADTTMLEMLLRLLQTTSAIVAVELVHIHLLCIYSMRLNVDAAEKHARLAVEIAYENKLYFPLATYYRYNAPLLASILEHYPEEFKLFCKEISTQFENSFSAFLVTLGEHAVVFDFSSSDTPYIYAVLMGLSNTVIAEKFGVSHHTVNRKLAKLCEKYNVENKKELRDFLHNYM